MTVEARERQILMYTTHQGRQPFREWFDKLRDERAMQKIDTRVARVRRGNLGITRSAGEGVLELKIDYGPGYRLYVGQDGAQLIILLCGGD